MRLHKISVVIIMVMSLLACNNFSDLATALIDDTALTANNDTNIDTSGAQPELSQTASIEDPTLGTLSVNYPDGWGATTEGVITLANDPAILEQMGSTDGPEDGQLAGSFIPFDGASVGAADMSVSDAYDLISGFMLPEGFEPEISETSFGGNEAIVASGTTEIAGAAADMRLYFLQIGANYVVAQFITAEGSMSDFTGTLDAIAGTISLTPAG